MNARAADVHAGVNGTGLLSLIRILGKNLHQENLLVISAPSKMIIRAVTLFLS